MSGPVGERIVEVLDALESRYGRVRYVNRFDPMDELVSCILSQSSKDSSSFPAFTHLLETFADWEGVARAPLEAIVQVIRPAGLANQKAKAIQGCLAEIHRRSGGYRLECLREMTDGDAMEWLTSLPGVGHKTAAIVLCFAFGRPMIPVDTHVFRVAKRLGFVAESSNEARAHRELQSSTPKSQSFRLHTLFIQHGRYLCAARNPKCGECPVMERCPHACPLRRNEPQ